MCIRSVGGSFSSCDNGQVSEWHSMHDMREREKPVIINKSIAVASLCRHNVQCISNNVS